MKALSPLLDRLQDLGRSAANSGRSGLLLISSGGHGDTVLLSRVLPRFLGLAEPGEPVAVLLPVAGSATAFLLPPAVEVMRVDYPRLRRDPAYRWRTRAMLAGRRFRRVVTVDHLRHPHLDEALVAAAGAPVTEGFTPRPWPKYAKALDRSARRYTRLVETPPGPMDKVTRWTALANALTETDLQPPRMRLPDEALPPAHSFPRPTILVQPFSNEPARQPRPAFFRALLDAFPDHDARLLGAPGDLERQPDYRALLDRCAFDTTRLADLPPLLRGAALVVSVDTVLYHLASLMGARTLVLATAAYVGEITPYAEAVMPDSLRVLWHEMPCQGCRGDCVLPRENGMFPCVALHRVEDAIASARALMEQPP